MEQKNCSVSLSGSNCTELNESDRIAKIIKFVDGGGLSELFSCSLAVLRLFQTSERRQK